MKLKLNQWSLKRIKTLCGFLALYCSAANAQNTIQSQTESLINTIEEIRVAHRVPAIGITNKNATRNCHFTIKRARQITINR